MIVSIETPVIKGRWLMPAIRSVLAQTSSDWELLLLWDGGDEASRQILEKIQKLGHPRIRAFFSERRGIARARQFLTSHSCGDFILPLDDDDLLAPQAVARLLEKARACPWSSLIRARRDFIDDHGAPVAMKDWFPFESRSYFRGMTRDLLNHAQPTLIRRKAYLRTSGWEGFEDFFFAGEDCDICAKLEEIGDIELLDEVLYSYRLHGDRTSNRLGAVAAETMWRRIADKTIQRRALPLRRTNETQPFQYAREPESPAAKEMIEVVIPFREADEEELELPGNRPSLNMIPEMIELGHEVQRFWLERPIGGFDRLVVFCTGPASGDLIVEFFQDEGSPQPLARAETRLENKELAFSPVSLPVEGMAAASCRFFTVSFAAADSSSRLSAHGQRLPTPGAPPALQMRLFRRHEGYSAKGLARCLESLRQTGIGEDSIHVVRDPRSSAANRNAGFQRTSKPLVLFMDDDAWLESPQALDLLLAEMQRLDADLIGPKILQSNGRIYCAHPFFNSERMPIPRGLGEVDTGQHDYSAPTAWLPSTFLLARRRVCASIGGFDEAYLGSQMEDVDFCLKARSRGFFCFYAGSASVRHGNAERNNYFYPNLRYFQARWRGLANLNL